MGDRRRRRTLVERLAEGVAGSCRPQPTSRTNCAFSTDAMSAGTGAGANTVVSVLKTSKLNRSTGLSDLSAISSASKLRLTFSSIDSDVSNRTITVRGAAAVLGPPPDATGATSADAWKNPGSTPRGRGAVSVGFGAPGSGCRYVTTWSVSLPTGSSEYSTVKSSERVTFRPAKEPTTRFGVWSRTTSGYGLLLTRKSRIA